MANKNYSQKVTYQADLDIGGVIKSFQQLTSQLKSSGLKVSLFEGIEKDLAKATTLMNQFTLQMEKGFSSEQDVKNFQKNFASISSILNNVQAEFKGLDIEKQFSGQAAAAIKKIDVEIGKVDRSLKELNKTRLLEIERLTKKNDIDSRVSKEFVKTIKETNNYGLAVDTAVDKVDSLIVAQEKLKKKMPTKNLALSSLDYEFVETKKPTEVGKGKYQRTIAVSDTSLRKETRGGGVGRSISDTAAQAKINDVYTQSLLSIAIAGRGTDDVMNLLISSMDKYGVAIQGSRKFSQSMEGDLAAAKTFYKENIASIDEHIVKLKEQRQVLLDTKAGGGFAGNIAEIDQKVIDKENEIVQLEKQKALAVKEFGQKAATANKIAAEGSENVSNKMNVLETEYRDVDRSVVDLTTSQSQLDATFDNLQNRITMLFSIGSAFQFIRRTVSQTFEDVKALDKAFASIAMVSDFSVDGLWGNYEQFAEIAEKYGQRTKDVIEASSLYVQQGLNMADSLALTEETMQLATLSGSGFAEATSQMTAAIRGFKMEMDEGGRVLDVYSELAAKAAADVKII